MRTDRNYRPGALNVQVNGIQIEDLYIQHQAYKRKIDELVKLNTDLSNQLKEQGLIINTLRDEIAQFKAVSDIAPLDKLKDLDLPTHTKEDLIDLLDEFPGLFEMTELQLKILSSEIYSDVNGYHSKADSLENKVLTISKYIEAKFGDRCE